MTGIAFMGKLRMKGDQTPLLIITGVPNKDLVMHAANALKVGFLAKPFTITDLMVAVENLMNL